MGPGHSRRKDRPWLHALLGVLTLTSIFCTHYVVFTSEDAPGQRAAQAAMFSLAVFTILGCHEMGHYLMARRHGVDASLPFFIPLPLVGLFGTLGAVIRLRDRIPDRNALVDIGAAGPLAGLAVAIPVLCAGLRSSVLVRFSVTEARAFPAPGSLWALGAQLGRQLLQGGAGSSTPEEPARAIAVSFGQSLLGLGLERWIVGPIPPGFELRDHPLAIAGWLGLLVTMLNLMPVGQLDGGHVTHALWGGAAERVGRLAAGVMAGLCLFFSVGWLLWLLVTVRFIGFRHPEVVHPDRPLSPARRWICWLCLLALVLCLMPLPITQVAVR